jgi:kynureninase
MSTARSGAPTPWWPVDSEQPDRIEQYTPICNVLLYIQLTIDACAPHSKWLGGHGGCAVAVLDPKLLSVPPPSPGWMGAPDPFAMNAQQLLLAPDARRYTQSTMSYISLAGLTAALVSTLSTRHTLTATASLTVCWLVATVLSGSSAWTRCQRMRAPLSYAS